MATGTVQNDFRPKLLWENSDVTSNFAEQTINGTSGYPYYFILFNLSTSTTTKISVLLKTITSVANVVEFIFYPANEVNYLAGRQVVKQQDGKLHFYSAMRKDLTATARTTDNSLLIPYQIYGISWSNYS